MRTCAWHRPGNFSCQFTATYEIEWDSVEAGKPYRRIVCDVHLHAALDSALELRHTVRVRYLNPETGSPAKRIN